MEFACVLGCCQDALTVLLRRISWQVDETDLGPAFSTRRADAERSRTPEAGEVALGSTNSLICCLYATGSLLVQSFAAVAKR